ncbi:MAG: 1,6-anhydro-N-acetylmuramyl-L-alanine amidase AmpD [Perlucidibaca sp.]
MHITADHWLSTARRCPSPFFNERPAGEISLVVLHNISLPPGQFGGPWIDQLFSGTLASEGHPYFAEIHGMEVSAHLLIRRDGEVVQYVPFDARAWHAGRSCYQGRENCNDFSIGIELEGCDDQPFDDRQYDSLHDVLRAIWMRYPDTREALTGHSDIAPGRKTDPGPSLDWERVRAQPRRRGDDEFCGESSGDDSGRTGR